MRLVKAFLAAVLATLIASATASGQSKLELKVFTSSPAGFLVNSTLIAGTKDAILIDAQFTRADAHRLVAWVIESSKNLTTVYVTHDHPDHYFGLDVIRQAFPKAKFVALPGALAAIKRTAMPKVAQWKPAYGTNVTSAPVIPTPLVGSTITLEGETLQVIGPAQGDDKYNSYVWIPSLRAVVVGDIAFNGLHVWTAETNPAGRRAWAETLDKILALGPTVVVAGHQRPELGTAPSSLTFTKDYLALFDEALASSKSAEELQSSVKSRYPDLALDIVLKIGAEAAFKATSK
jgi:glyoxylase-like metal-dependent hydrolase (beta-lactamase superfamily II)